MSASVVAAPPRSARTELDQEVALVERAIRRDADAFGELYDLHIDRVYRHVRQRVASTQEAEDITAQTFLNAWQSIQRYRPMGYPFAVWLLRIAHNLVISAYRKKHQATVPLPEDESDEMLGDSTSLRLMESCLDRQTLWPALMQLKKEYREVLLLRIVEDLPRGEVAALLGKTGGAVAVLQHRALRALRKILERDGQDSPSAETIM
ncbi:MAG: sigma-70 family RNA polymerase sigma factor [Chloroflexi bacterium]|nr:sigma-70 family RNA polymerase sigma factor [Chloroflexota bacterium]